MEFEDFNLSSQLLEAIRRLGYKKPTQIQERSIKHILEGKDVIGESATGSGKTLVFGCGIIEHTIPGRGLQALVLTPTRELAEQVKESLIQLSYGKNLRIISVYGGVSINPQIDLLQTADVVVATPGRFLDHMERGTVDTSRIDILVLDEADRMFDMGFIDDVRKIISVCENRKQTLFFSATMSYDIMELAKTFTRNPVKVFAQKMVDPAKLKQGYYDVDRSMKLSLLVHLLKKEKAGLIMVFCNTRKSVDFVFRALKANRINSVAIHGGLTQNKRTRTIELFNKGKVSVLICTDVAARGLHIDNVSYIYNYDIPKDSTDYIHRIGRTARAGEEGKVINLLCHHDHDSFGRILNEHREFRIDNIQKPYIEKVRFQDYGGQRKGDSHYGSYRGHSRNDYRGPRRGPPRHHHRRAFT